MTVWIVGGTGDSATIVKTIATVTSDLIVTVTTPEAKQLYDSDCLVIAGKMNRESMIGFGLDRGIKAIVDASHPFAMEVSQNAIATAKMLDIPYLRYERNVVDTPKFAKSFLYRQLDSWETLLKGNYLLGKRVLLTVGCKVLPQFQPWQDRATLFARILPKPDSLQTAIDSGFTSDRIIALRPPFSEALEIALWQQWQISLVITKASGKPGGEEIKQKVAAKLNIPLIAIARPSIVYPQKTSSISTVIDFVQRYLTDLRQNQN